MRGRLCCGKKVASLIKLFALVALVYGGCARGEQALINKYGADADYYKALIARRDGDETLAAALFAKCALSGTSIAARRSSAELMTVDNEADKKARVDPNAFFDESNDDGDDEDTDEKTAVNGITNTRKGKNAENSHNAGEITALPSAEGSTDGNKGDIKELLHKYIEDREYGKAYSAMDTAMQYIMDNPRSELSSMVSDMGKAALYTAGDKLPRAREMDKVADIACHAADNRDSVYNALFYAGRLYAAAGEDSMARSRFYSAAGSVPTGKKSDNALWYLLNMEFNHPAASERTSDADTNLQADVKIALDALNACHTLWFDASYFDDLMEMLSQKLLSHRLYGKYADVCMMLSADRAVRNDVYASCKSMAQYAYVYARLVQEGLLQDRALGLPSAQQALESALNGGAERYYRVLSIAKLQEYDKSWANKETINKVMLHTAKARGIHSDSDKRERLEKFLMGFADFGLTEMIYPQWQSAFEQENVPYIGMECATYLAKTLYNAGFIEQCLRLIGRSVLTSETGELKQDALECLFPLGYMEEIAASCKEFGVNEEYAFALVRSESFFNSQAVSSAGAVGLTQIMSDTGHDIAKSLKKESAEETDLRDAACSIEFGMKYLSDLMKSVDGPPFLAFLAYNTGLTRIRRYIAANASSPRPLPLDLLLETLPYEETRSYGRKLLSAAVMYGYLYYEKTVEQVVKEVMQAK